MRFAIAGVDRYLGVFETFIAAGWQPVKLFTVPLKQPARETNHSMIALAEQHGAAIQLSQMTETDLRDLQACGCEALIVASYKWRVCDWTPYLSYAANFHASPLPEARGAYPMVRAILEERKEWAITCHKIAPRFDRGDILAARHFPLTPTDCHESLDLKIQMAARRLATDVARDFHELWQSAIPQGAGSYWPLWKPRERALDFRQSVAAIMRHIRAFGLVQSLAFVGGRWLSVRRAVGWEETGSPAPGTVAHVNNRTIVVAAQDGYIGLIEWEFADEQSVAALSIQ